jgi:cardiolipin synthase A/B
MKTARLLVVPAAIGALLCSGVVAQAAPTAHPQSADSTYSLLTMPDQGWQPVYDFMNTATKTLDMTMYELKDTTAVQTLTALAAKGVTVRVILDQNLEKSSNTAAYNDLKAGGVQVVWANTKYAATHQKTITVDGTNSLILTGNLTSEYYATTRDFGMTDNNTYDVNAIEKVFNADFTGAAITPTDGDNLVWSPTDSQTQITALINGAKTSLEVENEEMGDPTVTTDLENAAKRGVNVEITMTNSGGDYATEFNALVAAGAHVSTYTGETPLYIHAKAIVADGATVYVGSENFSDYSLNKNRELGMITTNASILNGVNSTLASDFQGATPWTSS